MSDTTGNGSIISTAEDNSFSNDGQQLSDRGSITPTSAMTPQFDKEICITEVN